MYVSFEVVVHKTSQLTCHSFTGDRYLPDYPVVKFAEAMSCWKALRVHRFDPGDESSTQELLTYLNIGILVGVTEYVSSFLAV